MREILAERLLAKVMNWTPENVANERPLLQAMAELKYDKYQQFAPGMRFVESLALWLRQFKTEKERLTAYEFVKLRLVFFSTAEIAHLVTIAYPDHIRPLLIRQAAKTIEVDERFIVRVANSKEYQTLRRECLFLGLSDGAHIDTFRRSTHAELSHEQIWQTYEMSPKKGDNMLSELRQDLIPKIGKANTSLFRMIFLLDDFSGSGMTYLRKDDESEKLAGKIAKFRDQLQLKDGLGKLVDLNDLYVGIIFYVITQHAIDYLTPLLKELFRKDSKVNFELHYVHLLDNNFSLDAVRDKAFFALTEKYYDSNAENKHTRIGGTNVRQGFAGCGLPLVLSHNTPNNSVFLLWAEEKYQVHGLFPRVSRHRS
jgi:hypothetical protein